MKNSPNVDQPNMISTTTNLITKAAVECGWTMRITRQIMRAMVKGNTQYPRTHTLWKKDLKSKNITNSNVQRRQNDSIPSEIVYNESTVVEKIIGG